MKILLHQIGLFQINLMTEIMLSGSYQRNHTFQRTSSLINNIAVRQLDIHIDENLS